MNHTVYSQDLLKEKVTPLPFSVLQSVGLLWLINTSVFHPRGFSLALTFDVENSKLTQEMIDSGEVQPTGFTLQGDGTEAFNFSTPERVDECFSAVREFFANMAVINSAKEPTSEEEKK